jgi:hypothetical protein
MKYTFACRVFNIAVGGIMKKEIAKRRGKRFAESTAKKARLLYKQLILRTPEIGHDNPFLSNLLMGAVFVAWRIALREDMDIREIDAAVISALGASKLVRLRSCRSDQTSVKYRKWLGRSEKWTKEHAEAYLTSWIVRVDNAREGCTAFSITRCGLWEMCRRENCPEFCSTLCRTDYVMADFGKAALTRNSTLADGAECCDFLYIRKTTT